MRCDVRVSVWWRFRWRNRFPSAPATSCTCGFELAGPSPLPPLPSQRCRCARTAGPPFIIVHSENRASSSPQDPTRTQRRRHAHRLVHHFVDWVNWVIQHLPSLLTDDVVLRVFVGNNWRRQLHDRLHYLGRRWVNSGVRMRERSVGSDCSERRLLGLLIAEVHSTLLLLIRG